MRKRQPDIRKLATRQRWLVWMVLASLLIQAVPFLFIQYFPPSPFTGVFLTALGFAQYAVTILIAIGAILIMAVDGTHIAIIVLVAIFLFAPCANLVILLLINRRATRLLRAAGLKVGLMGVNPDEAERVLNPSLCKTCGYNLTGNLSGTCPECGTPLPVAPPTTPQ